MESEKAQAFISLILKIFLAILAILTLLRGEFVWFIGILFALFLTLVPTILARDFYVKLPLVFDVAITVSVFFHAIGGYVDWYDNIPGYDHFTHFLTSTTVSLIGVTLLYILVFTLKVTHLPPFFFGFFTVLFTMSMGVIWEFLEWGFDMAFGTELQHGLHDTMLDLMFDTMAGIIVGVISIVRLKQGEAMKVEDLVVGDITTSVGYKRWQMLRDKDKDLSEKIRVAFKDPIILEGIFDHIVREYKHISEKEERIWHKLKKKMKK
ncbi:MAG: hypothetical protein JSV49_00925 [Thermoplasmata archaeon]|nr:MAG: hypothetical protein JSV49_00925 [Thermoplasmata archaeon]